MHKCLWFPPATWQDTHPVTSWVYLTPVVALSNFYQSCLHTVSTSTRLSSLRAGILLSLECYKKIPSSGWLKRHTITSHVLEAQTSKIRASADPAGSALFGKQGNKGFLLLKGSKRHPQIQSLWEGPLVCRWWSCFILTWQRKGYGPFIFIIGHGSHSRGSAFGI